MYVPSSVVTCSNGEPEENSARPCVAFATALEVHSALDVGFERGMMMGRSLNSPIIVKISSVNKPFTVDAPNSTVGLASFTTVARGAPSRNDSGDSSSSSSSPSPSHAFRDRANGRRSSTPGAFLSSLRLSVTRPCLSTMKNRSCASSEVSPWCTIAVCRKFAMPIPAEPAPHTRNVCFVISAGCNPSAAMAPYTPASTTTAVPWMSSLKHNTLSLCRRKIGMACSVWKSSNCTSALGHLFFTAWMNSSTTS
mmetsp:Transcript_12270/g.45678  ORF Transcript_12270/g.45678 Transcript_12270/m.45678 type:complete len:252 (-) Transcript_12270:903-1658(-)